MKSDITIQDVFYNILKKESQIVHIYYDKERVYCVEYLTDHGNHIVYINKIDININTKLFYAFFYKDKLMEMYDSDNLFPVSIEKHENYDTYIFSCSNIKIPPIDRLSENIEDCYIMQTYIENGGYLMQFTISKMKLLKILDKCESDKIFFSLSSDTLIVDEYEMSVSGRYDLSLSFNIKKEILLDCLDFIDGNIINISFEQEENCKSLDLDIKDCIASHVKSLDRYVYFYGSDSSKFYHTTVLDFNNRLPVVDQSHKDGNFKRPMINRKQKKKR